MKKLLSLTLAALMAVSMLSGCSNGSDNSSTAQNSGEEPTGTITLKIAHNMGLRHHSGRGSGCW